MAKRSSLPLPASRWLLGAALVALSLGASAANWILSPVEPAP